jgi:hypothetical protein
MTVGMLAEITVIRVRTTAQRLWAWYRPRSKHGSATETALHPLEPVQTKGLHRPPVGERWSAEQDRALEKASAAARQAVETSLAEDLQAARERLERATAEARQTHRGVLKEMKSRGRSVRGGDDARDLQVHRDEPEPESFRCSRSAQAFERRPSAYPGSGLRLAR